MNKNSNSYIIIYATILVVAVAAVLSFVAISLQPLQMANVEVEKMGAILTSIGEGKGAAEAPNKDQYIKEEYKKYIVSSFCVNAEGATVEGADAFKALDDLPEVFELKTAMPIFEAKLDNGLKLYVIPTRGKGLWGPVWAYIALNADCNTIYGASFDHKSETPGLGAEISLPAFGDKFVGKQLFKDGVFQSIVLTKIQGSSQGNPHSVDGISGGTLTSNGVAEMLKRCLGDYVPFFKKIQEQSAIAVALPATDSTAMATTIAAADTLSNETSQQ